jgi:quercetin dioxygenase-like cupin family protein
MPSWRKGRRGSADLSITHLSLFSQGEPKNMEITRFPDAKRYDAPKHFEMRALRLQGFDVSGSKFASVGLSYFLPGGGAEMDAGSVEKIYVVLAGQVTIELGDGAVHHLRALDSCLIPPGEARAVRNETNDVATMLVLMPYPNGVRP